MCLSEALALLGCFDLLLRRLAPPASLAYLRIRRSKVVGVDLGDHLAPISGFCVRNCPVDRAMYDLRADVNVEIKVFQVGWRSVLDLLNEFRDSIPVTVSV